MSGRICPDCEKPTDSETCPECGVPTLDVAPFRRREDPLLGKLVGGRFRVQELLGHGGMGKVYVAEQVAMKRRVALKVIHTQDSGDVSDKMLIYKRFQREALAASRLEHHNTVRVFDFGMGEDGTLFLAMELLRGTTLAKLMQGGPVPPRRAINIAVQICKSLSEAHEKGIIHRDMKPDNVMVFDTAGERDFVKVLDFGIAKIAASTGESSITRTGMIMGTPAYMAPEQAHGSNVGPATDLYSLGIILYEALTGRPPFSGETPLAVLLKHVNDRVPPLVVGGFPPNVPQGLADIVYRLLEKDPARRPGSAMELAGLLERVEFPGAERARVQQTDVPSPAVAPPRVLRIEDDSMPRGPAARPAWTRGRWWVVGGGALLAIFVVLAALWTGLGASENLPKALTDVPPASSAAPPVPSSGVPEIRESPPEAEAASPMPAPAPVPAVVSVPAVAGVAEEPSDRGKSTEARSNLRDGTKAKRVRVEPAPKRCVRSKCPITGDCVDGEGRRLDGGSFCGDIAF